MPDASALADGLLVYIVCARAGSESLADLLHRPAGSRTQGETATVSELMRLLQDQCAVVSRILNDVLSLQKMEDGRFTLDMMAFAPEQFVYDTVHAFRADFEARHHRVLVRVQPLDQFVGMIAGHNGEQHVTASGDGIADNERALLPSSPVNQLRDLRPLHADSGSDVVAGVGVGEALAATAPRAVSSRTGHADRYLLVGGKCWCCAAYFSFARGAESNSDNVCCALRHRFL